MTASPPLPTREPMPVEAISVYGGHRARFRKATGGWDWVRENGEPQVYPSEQEALLAAWAARDAHFHGHGILSTGDRAQLSHSAADRIFRGGGKVVEVVRR